MPELWFRARRYGWGWTPATWQGWFIVAVYAIAMIGWAAWLMPRPGATWLSVLPILVLSALLVLVGWIKGERPRWRWGK